MVDDTSQQPVQDNSQITNIPVVPSATDTLSDQNTSASPSTDVGQIPAKLPIESETTPSASIDKQSDDWPISPNLANEQTATPSAQPSETKEEKQT